MAAETATLCSALLFVVVFVSSDDSDLNNFAEQTIITSQPGYDVTLTCRAPNDDIVAVKWSRADLESEHVLLYQDGHIVPDNQHPAFKERVELRDTQVKDGDVSLILKDVIVHDTGTYECGVFTAETHSWTSVRIFNLRVVATPEQRIFVTAETGQDVTLPCRASYKYFETVKWSRADQESENVFFYTGRMDSYNQHPSFKDRVELQDRQMKDGDASLILKDVTTDDVGAYECRVFMEGAWKWEFLCIINLSVDPPDEKTITAESGQDVTLRCQAPNNINIIAIEWIRTDLEPEYVFVYRGGEFDPDHQHPSFKNRVDLRDRQMKYGDVSVILKDVTADDEGAYECGIVQSRTNRWKRSADTISIIYLRVAPPANRKKAEACTIGGGPPPTPLSQNTGRRAAEGISGGTSSEPVTPQGTSGYIKYADGLICFVEPSTLTGPDPARAHEDEEDEVSAEKDSDGPTKLPVKDLYKMHLMKKATKTDLEITYLERQIRKTDLEIELLEHQLKEIKKSK